MTKPLNYYSTNREDEPILNQIAPRLWCLALDHQIAVAIAALYEAYEPDAISFDYDRYPSRCYDKCIELIQLLSKSGKLALCRAITEHLAVREMAGERTISAITTTPGTPLARVTTLGGLK